MSKLKIITVPEYENKLHQKSKPVDIKDINSADMQKFFTDLIETMFKADGIGLAAPQVNKLIQVCAVNLGDNQAKIFINPKIKKKSLLKNLAEEGCLSIPNVYGKVKRHNKIKVGYYDDQGKKQINTYTNYIARILQHEIDHLNGILFTDKMEK